MNKPHPTQFSLTDQTVASLDAFEDQKLIRVDGYLFATAAIAGFVVGVSQGTGMLGALFLGGLYAVVGAASAFIPIMALSASWTSLAGLISPTIRNYARYKKRLRQYEEWERRTKMEFWQSLPGLTFEAELARLFHQAGYRVQLTPPSGDKGVDILLQRDGRTTIVQCKATAKPVGPAVAREVYGTLVSTGADEAILATIGGLSTGAREFLRDKPVHVMTLSEILALQADPPSYPDRLRLTRELEWPQRSA